MRKTIFLATMFLTTFFCILIAPTQATALVCKDGTQCVCKNNTPSCESYASNMCYAGNSSCMNNQCSAVIIQSPLISNPCIISYCDTITGQTKQKNADNGTTCSISDNQYPDQLANMYNGQCWNGKCKKCQTADSTFSTDVKTCAAEKIVDVCTLGSKCSIDETLMYSSASPPYCKHTLNTAQQKDICKDAANCTTDTCKMWVHFTDGTKVEAPAAWTYCKKILNNKNVSKCVFGCDNKEVIYTPYIDNNDCLTTSTGNDYEIKSAGCFYKTINKPEAEGKACKLYNSMGDYTGFTGVCQKSPDGLLACVAKDCSDGFDCTFDQVEENGSCSHSIEHDKCLIGGKCYSEGNSNPNNFCQECASKTSNISWSNKAVGLTCDDGKGCTTNDQCTNKSFTLPSGVTFYFMTCAGTPIVCEDGDICNGTKACVETSATREGYICMQSTLPLICTESESSNTCAFPACKPGFGCSQKYYPVGTPCDDGNKCTEPDTCYKIASLSSQGHGWDRTECAPGQAISCDDNNKCTDDDCDPLTGCTHKDNGKCCTQGSCDDHDPCTEDSCSEDTKQCLYKDISIAHCNDNNKCTTDQCNPNAAIGQECEHVDIPPVSDGIDCTNDICNKATGATISTPDDNKCPNDNNPCTDEKCDAKKGCVEIALIDQPCDDGSACTKDDKCKQSIGPGGQVICNGVKFTCADNNPCTDDKCDNNTGCIFTFIKDLCPDCKTECNDGNPCTMDYCDKDTDPKNPVCNNLMPVSLVDMEGPLTCSADNNVCTVGDHCDDKLLQCVPGSSTIDCSDGDDCTTDSCDPAMGCMHTPLVIAGVCPPETTVVIEDQPQEVVNTLSPCQVDVGREVTLSDGSTVKLVASPVEQEAVKITEWNDRIRKAINAPVDLFIGESGGQARATLNLPNIKTMVVSKGAYIARTFQMTGAKPLDYTKFATKPVWTENTLKQPLQIVPTEATISSTMAKNNMKESDVMTALPAPSFSYDVIPSEAVTVGEKTPNVYEIPNVLRVTFGVSAQASKNAVAIGSGAAVVDPLSVEILSNAPVMNCTWANDSCPDIGPVFTERFPMVDDPNGKGQVPKVLVEIEKIAEQLKAEGIAPSPAIIYEVLNGGKAVWDTIGYGNTEYTLLPDILAAAEKQLLASSDSATQAKFAQIAKDYKEGIIKAANAQDKAAVETLTFKQMNEMGICPGYKLLLKPLEMEAKGSGCGCFIGNSAPIADKLAGIFLILMSLVGIRFASWRMKK